jgi:predicted nucleic acid-binding protein
MDTIIRDKLPTAISVLAVAVSTGLPGADAIHFVSAISLPEVNEIITLDRHFKRVKDQIKVTLLSERER